MIVARGANQGASPFAYRLTQSLSLGCVHFAIGWCAGSGSIRAAAGPGLTPIPWRQIGARFAFAARQTRPQEGHQYFTATSA